MKLLTTVFFAVISFHIQAQVIPKVSPDSIAIKMFPIYFEAFKSGVFDKSPDISWQKLKTVEHASVSFKIPSAWIELGALGNIVEMAFDASGLYFPEQYNSRPLLTGLFLLNWPGKTLDEVKDSVLANYRNNPDRVFEENYKDSVYTYKLAGNTNAYILHTRFYRKTPQLNQSRFDLVFFSEKLKRGYSLMISIQYNDPTYKFEQDNFLNLFAAKIFEQVEVKKND
ncbi:MAG: hypothetical protein NTW29_19800 [Bacteroidetes bacterium]|nr:hypothetical protein [Bacteroidota bacterium]